MRCWKLPALLLRRTAQPPSFLRLGDSSAQSKDTNDNRRNMGGAVVEQREKWKHLSAKERREEEEERRRCSIGHLRARTHSDGRAVKKGMPLEGDSNGVWASLCHTIHVAAKTGVHESGTATATDSDRDRSGTVIWLWPPSDATRRDV